MIDITNKKDCCGCSACAQRCPKKCITMKENFEGFLYPNINNAACISCGLCEKVCPIQNKEEKESFLGAYVAYANDLQLRERSSSGAIFSLCVERVLEMGGVVFGAAFDEDFAVQHIKIDKLEELWKLQGSKYLESCIGNSFNEAEQFLKQGRTVLFSGTCCQIEGLKHFLGCEYDNLFTIDVLCHGVPSPKVWKRYWSEKNKLYGKGQSVSFRDKENGWKQYDVKFTFENDKVYKESAYKNPYMKLFLNDICLRLSCHDCKFKSLNRLSDITLGDSWGIEKYKPHMDDDKGTSVVLIHSEKGRRLFDSCKEKMTFEEAEVDKILPPSADSRKSVLMHPKRDKFFSLLNRGVETEKLLQLLKPAIHVRIKRRIRSVLSKNSRENA
ncbi:Coenzyme F420 hydrogenase/dehydrogenase, beta subunit C-terminal domain [Acetivibrio mesophilus]|nr:Coenzyme F420 hydrogenase/dehydrogenase, beta subunit C-terminal domain [Acetivibrio mesophilus]